MTEAALSIRLLGPVEVGVEGWPAPLRRGKERALVAALALEPGSLRSREFLTACLWPERAPEHPANALQGVVARVRRADPGLRTAIEEHDGAYRLLIPRENVDASRFEDALREARALAAEGEWREVRDRLEESLSARRGEPLGGSNGILGVEATRLDDLDADSHALLADARLALGESEGLADELSQVSLRHPLHEPLWERRLQALGAAGRRPEALLAYEELRTRLREELGIDVGEGLRRIHMDLVAGESEAPARPTEDAHTRRPRTRLTSFVGRERDLEALRRACESGARLVTIVGPGGVGKSRLATEWTIGDTAPRPISLEAIDPGDDVLAAVAAALSVPEDGSRGLAAVVARALPSGTTLVLDGAEHVRESTARAVEALIAADGELRILVTSRNAIGIPGERLLRLAPLQSEVPPDEAGALPDAGRLVLDRASSADPDLDPRSPTVRAAAAEIGARLDGLPLAIELAAARSSVLSLEQLAASLDADLDLLEADEPGRPRRQRTLSATVAWSLEPLAPVDRRLFAISSVFASVFDGDALAVLAGTSPASTFAAIVRLAEHSLLEPARNHADTRGPCFRMLAPIRARARAMFADLDEHEVVRERYEQLICDLVERGDTEIRGFEQQLWIARFDRLRGDFEQVLTDSIEARRLGTASRITAALGRYWDWRGRLCDATRWTQAVMDASTQAQGHPSRLGAVVSWRAWWALELGDYELAEQLAAEGERLSRELGDSDGELTAIATLAVLRRATGSAREAAAESQRGLVVAESAGDRWSIAWSVNSRGYARVGSDDIQGAEDDASSSGAMFDELGDDRAANWARLLSGIAALRRGERDRAADISESARGTATALGDERTAAAALEVLAEAAPNRAASAELLAAAQALRDRRGQANPAFPDAGRPTPTAS